MSSEESGCGLFKTVLLVLAACLFSVPASAEAAGKLQRAQEHKQTAIGHLKKAQYPGADKAAESKKAVAALKSALALLQQYKEPRPREVEQEMQDINSLIYWVRKMAPISVSDLKHPPRPERRTGKSRERLARDYFQRAQDYARRNADDNFLIAIKYFEVADRFRGTKWSLEAQGLSLEYQRRLLAGGTDRPAAARERPAGPVPERLPAAVRLARKLENQVVELLLEVERNGKDASAKSRRALHGLTQTRDLLVKKRKPRPPEYVRELENVRVLAYWMSRKTRVKDAGGLEKLYLPTEPPEKASSRLFEKADDYARRRRSDSFVIAARYFEVADRYSETGAAEKARALYARYHDAAISGEVVADAETALPVVDDRPAGPKSARDVLVERLAEMSRAPDVNPEDKLDACDRFLREFPGDGLAREVTALMDIFGSTEPEERVDALREYAGLFPEGHFVKYLPKVTDPAKEREDFDALVSKLRSDSPPSEKVRGCREFLTTHGVGGLRDEVASLEQAFSASGDDQKIAAWAKYRILFPDGALAGEALKLLSRSETVLIAHMRRALSEGEETRTVELGKLYLDVFPEGPAAQEIGSLLAGVMKPSPGPERKKAIEKHLRTYPGSALAGALKAMADEWGQAAGRAAFAKLVREFAASGSDADRLRVCGRFLADHPRGGRAKEVKALRAAYALSRVKARLAATRRYLSGYARGPFAGHLKALEQRLVGAVEEEAYRAARAMLSDNSKSYAARLAACESYVTEFPDGRHVEGIRAREQELRGLIGQADQAFKELHRALSRLSDSATGSPGQGISLCDKFLRKYPGSVHRTAVIGRKREFDRRLADAAEAEAFKSLKSELAEGSATQIEKADACLRFMSADYTKGGGKRRGEVVRLLRSLAPVRLGAFAAPVRAAVFSADSKHLFVMDAEAGASGTGVHVLELPGLGLAKKYRLEPTITVRSAAFSPDGGRLFLGEETGGLTVVDILGGEVLGRYRLGPGPIVAVSLTPGGTVVTASLGDSKLRSWRDGEWLSATAYPCPGGVSAGATGRDGETIATGGRDGRLQVFASGGREPEWSLPGAGRSGPAPGMIDCVAFSPDGYYLASASAAQGVVSLRSASSGEELWSVEDGSSSVAFLDDDRLATSGCIRSVKDGRVVAKLGGSGPVAASPDGRFVFTGREDGTGTVWYVPALLEE